jgi:hypothetical protein
LVSLAYQAVLVWPANPRLNLPAPLHLRPHFLAQWKWPQRLWLPSDEPEYYSHSIGIVTQPWRTAQVFPPNRWKKSIVELLSKGDILHLFGISDFNFISPQNHKPAALSIQAQVAVASFGWHWGSLWPLHSLGRYVSCPQPAWLRITSFPFVSSTT